jgi:hypothetical protein
MTNKKWILFIVLVSITCVSLSASTNLCWGMVFDYSAIGTFVDRNQVSGSISGDVWIDDNGYAPSFNNLSQKGDFTYNITYFNLIFESPVMDFTIAGTGSLRIEFWQENSANPSAGYRNFNDSFILVPDSGGPFATANIFTNTGNFIDDFASIPTQFFLSGGGFIQFTEPAPGIQRMDLTLTQAAPVPEPATILIFGAGLIGLASYGRKKHS